MSDEFEQQDWVKIGVASTLTKQYLGDQREFFALLAPMLQRALPDETETHLRGGLFSKKTLYQIVVTVDSQRYTLEDPGRGPLVATRTHIVRGIALKTEPVPVQDWITELCEILERRAKDSAQAREALSKMVGY